MDFNIGPIDIPMFDTSAFIVPKNINVTNYDRDTGILTFSDGSAYDTNTDIITFADGSTYDLNKSLEEAFSNLDANNYSDIFAALETTPETFSGMLTNTYQDTANLSYRLNLGKKASQIADYFDNWNSILEKGFDPSKNVNQRDDAYNETSKLLASNVARNLGSWEDIRTIAGLPDYFSIYDDYNSQSTVINEDTVKEAYSKLVSGQPIDQVLSEYYGVDINLADVSGSDYTNINKYGVNDQTSFEEFQSIIKPIIEKALPYVMLTQGLEYGDAMAYMYSHDPMVASIYSKYGVDLFRQTSDGSTYIFDPLQGQEVRTLEVKDATFSDYLPALAVAVATWGAGTGISAALTSAGMSASTASAVGSALASGIAAAAQGGDLSDVLTSMATAGVLDYGLGVLSESDTVRDTLNSLGEEFGFGTSVEQIGGSFVPSGLTESGITGGDFIGGLAQFGAEAGSGLGDVLSSVAQAMVDPSWTPASVEDANIITNFVEQTSNNTELLGGLSNLGLTTDTLKSIYDTAKSVYDSSQEEPTITPTVDINLDPTQTDPITVDEETGDVTIGLPQIEDTTDGGGATDSTTDITDTTTDTTVDTTDTTDITVDTTDTTDITTDTTDTTVDTTDTTDDTAGTIFDPQHPWIYRGNGVFVHGKTGETVTEDVSGYDPYVVGESYGRGTDEPDSTTQEDTTGGLDIFVDTTDSDGDGLLDSEDPFPNDPLNGTDDGGTDDGTGTIGTTKSKTTTTTNKSTTPTTETTEPTLPDETGGYGTGGTTDGGTDTTTTGGTGDGGGDGDGNGDGDGSGIGSGSGSGMFGLGGGGGSQPITPQSFMASISYAPELLTPYMPRQSKDYLAELIARLQK